MGRRLIDSDRLQPCNPFINITSHWCSAEAYEKNADTYARTEESTPFWTQFFNPKLLLHGSLVPQEKAFNLKQIEITPHNETFSLYHVPNLLFPHFVLFSALHSLFNSCIIALCCGLISSLWGLHGLWLSRWRVSFCHHAPNCFSYPFLSTPLRFSFLFALVPVRQSHTRYSHVHHDTEKSTKGCVYRLCSVTALLPPLFKTAATVRSSRLDHM